MHKTRLALVACGAIFASDGVLAAKPADNAVMTHQSANMQAGQPGPSPSNQSKMSSGMMLRKGQPEPPPETFVNLKKPQATQPAPKVILPTDEVVNVPVPQPRAVAPGGKQGPAPAGNAPARVDTLPTSPGIDNLASIRDANQARMFDEARQAADALRELTNVERLGGGVNPDLGLGAADGSGIGGRAVDMSKLPGHDVTGYGLPEGTLAMPDLPDNQASAPPGIVGAPSGDLSSAMAGAAGGLGDVLYDLFFGSDEPVVRLPAADPEQVRVIDISADRSTVETTVTRADSETTVVRSVGEPTYRTTITSDGFGRTQIVEDDPVTEAYSRNPKEQAEYMVQQARERGHTVIEQPDGSTRVVIREPVPSEMAREDQASGNAAARHYDHSAKKGAPIIDRVNPGRDSAMQGQQATRMVWSEDFLVTNPSPENAGQGRELSEEQARAMGERLREEVKGPGGHPGDAAVGTTLQAGAAVEAQ